MLPPRDTPRFDSATHRAVVWVDGARVAEHEGGYTPFEADVTDLVEPGAESRITEVVVGEQVWNFADLATVPGVIRAGGNKKDAFTRERNPKAASALRQRWQGRG